MLQKAIHIFECVDEILKCDHTNLVSANRSFGAIYYVVKGGFILLSAWMKS